MCVYTNLCVYTYLEIFLYVTICVYVKLQLMISPADRYCLVLICNFLMTNGVEHVFICIFGICILSDEIVCLDFFLHILKLSCSDRVLHTFWTISHR